MNSRIAGVVLMLVALPGLCRAQSDAPDEGATTTLAGAVATLADAEGDGKPPSPAPGTADAPGREGEETPYFTWGNRKVFVGLDFAFISYKDWAMDGSLGRERQMVPSRLVISIYGDLSERISYRAELNPVARSIVPRPYVPSPDDRRTYFFPNQPDMPGSRGVVSTPEGLYNVDTYKTMGVDPIHHLAGLRVGYVDMHTRSRRYGVQVGRVYVPQGLGLDNVTWYSAKDLAHMQLIDAAADNGAMGYVETGTLRVELALVTGNGAPFHDYGYFDFTAGEDKNSAVATMSRATFRPFEGFMVGGSIKHNYVNSRIEDSITMSLSKRYDNALTGFVRWRQSSHLTVFGEVARYKWGLRDSSAELLAGPSITTPILKDGYFVGADLTSPRMGMARVSATLVRSELGRDDSLVAWAAANELFGVTLGKKERSNIVKLQGHVGGNLTLFYFWHDLSNPFPELSAIRPISGPGSDRAASGNKSGMGVQLRF
jgi:hypothetical protein